VRARTVLPPGLGAGTAYRGAGSDSTDGGANPACAAGGARKAGSGDCASAGEVAKAAMLPASMKDAIRIRIMVCSFGPLGHLRARARKALFVLADCTVILRQSFRLAGRSSAAQGSSRSAPLLSLPVRPARDWIKVKNPDSPAMIRGWDHFARLGRCRRECYGFEAECRNQETSIAERRVSMTFPFLSVRFLAARCRSSAGPNRRTGIAVFAHAQVNSVMAARI
jgi:hypothetical protein